MTDEIRTVSPTLADEMALTNFEMHLNAARAIAMLSLFSECISKPGNDMSASVDVSSRTAFFGLTAEEADARVALLSLERWRGKQLRAWVYGRLTTDPQLMTSFSAAQRNLLAGAFEFDSAQLVRHNVSSDGTMKLLLQWPDGQVAETVMIPDGKRRTACISSQVGCPVGCRFCASGIGGVKGNLSAARIVEQCGRLVPAHRGDRVDCNPPVKPRLYRG